MKLTKDKLVVLGLRNTPVILFGLIFCLFGLLEPQFLQFDTLENIVKQASFIGIVAVGMTFVLLTGGIDLSVGSNMYLSAVVGGLLINNYGVPAWVGLIICLMVGTVFGAINAIAITRLRIIPFVVTLSTLVAGRGIGLLLTKSRAVPFPEAVTDIGKMRILGLPMPIVIFATVVLVAYIFLHRSQLGRQIYAVGFDIEGARKAGINTRRVMSTAYVLCGALAALGGFISVAQLGNVNSGYGEGYEFNAIAATVLGGASLFGGIGDVFPGTVLGATLIQMVSAGLVFAQVDIYLQPLVQAAIIFIAVFIDSFRSRQLTRIGRRNIRIEDTG